VNVLVVPTNSSERLGQFLEAWAPWPWDRIVIVQDAPEADIRVPTALPAEAAERLEVFSWAEIDSMLPDPSIISRQDSAIRSFGFWYAWSIGAEIIFTLDDDCFPEDEDFVGRHSENLFNTPVWQSSVSGMRVRGLPYRNSGVLNDVQVSMGLWRGSPDIDAITTLSGVLSKVSIAATGTRVMAAAQYFPLSGMNLAFKRDVASLMYFPPMGHGQPYRRFDDIWCGITLQRICRHLGYSITCGAPLVNHQRASDPFTNLAKEAPGVIVNENVWETIDGVELSGNDPHACMIQMGMALAGNGDRYMAAWGTAIIAWCALFETPADSHENGSAANAWATTA
jgi:hypothetical protein